MDDHEDRVALVETRLDDVERVLLRMAEDQHRAAERQAASQAQWERATQVLGDKLIALNAQHLAIAEGVEVLGGAVGVLIDRSHSHEETG